MREIRDSAVGLDRFHRLLAAGAEGPAATAMDVGALLHERLRAESTEQLVAERCRCREAYDVEGRDVRVVSAMNVIRNYNKGEPIMQPVHQITFPGFTGVRCLMMPYIQGDSSSLPPAYAAYRDIIDTVYVRRGDKGFLTIDESLAHAGMPHRGARAKHGRALHTEAGREPGRIYCWGSGGGTGGGWGRAPHRVTLDRDVVVLLANNIDDTCAAWDAEHEETTDDGDIGHAAEQYPYDEATFFKRGEVYQIGILTPHESLVVPRDCQRQFLRIVSSGVHGREAYFTDNPMVSFD